VETIKTKSINRKSAGSLNADLERTYHDLKGHREAHREADVRGDDAARLSHGQQVEEGVEDAVGKEHANLQHGQPVGRRRVRAEQTEHDEQEGALDVAHLAPKRT